MCYEAIGVTDAPDIQHRNSFGHYQDAHRSEP